MALTDIFEDTLGGGVGAGLAVGLGVAVAVPLLRPLARGVLLPAAAVGLRGVFYLTEQARAGVGHAREFVEDAVAEARAGPEPAGEPVDPAPSVVRP